MIDERSVANAILAELPDDVVFNVDNRNLVVGHIERLTQSLRNERTDLRAALHSARRTFDCLSEPLGPRHDYTAEQIDARVTEIAKDAMIDIDAALEKTYEPSIAGGSV
jgi:hypothetical protein